MPQVLPAIALAAFNAGAPLVVVNAIVGVGVAGVIIHTAASLALTVGASYAIAKLTAPPAPKPSDGQIEFKQPLPTRFFNYGHMKVAGPVLFLETSDNNHSLNKVTAFGSRPFETIEKFFLDGKENTTVALIAPGIWELNNIRVVDDPHGWVRWHDGRVNQLADGRAVAQGLVQNPWTNAHRLRGIPYCYARFDAQNPEEFQEAFPTGPIEFMVVGGVQVYDPRRDPAMGPFGYYSGSGAQSITDPTTWEFSDNQRLCALDWLTLPDGYNKLKRLPDNPNNRIHWPTWVAQINMADQAVPLTSGGSEKRYRVATQVSFDEPRSRVLHRLMQAGDQQLFTTAEGLIGSRGGVWQDPTVSLQVEDMPEAFFMHGVPKMERVNEFELTCMLPQKDYVEFDLEPFGKTDDPDWIAGIKRRQRLDLNQVPSSFQARRLAKIYMSKRNPVWNGQIRTSFAGLNALGEDKVNLTFDELHTDAQPFNGPFWINGVISFLADKTGVTFPVASADPTAYDPPPEVPVPPEPGPDPDPDEPPPSGIPVLITPPTISSRDAVPTIGERCDLVHVGLWSNSPTSFARVWMRGGSDISPVHGDPYYVTVSGDLGFYIYCRVVATNSVGSSASAVSNGLGPVSASRAA